MKLFFMKYMDGIYLVFKQGQYKKFHVTCGAFFFSKQKLMLVCDFLHVLNIIFTVYFNLASLT